MRYIVDVSYRHASAYLTVTGASSRLAERRAKRVGTVLRQKLPEATICAPRDRGYTDDGQVMYEVPILIEQCGSKARSVLAQLFLKGSC